MTAQKRVAEDELEDEMHAQSARIKKLTKTLAKVREEVKELRMTQTKRLTKTLAKVRELDSLLASNRGATLPVAQQAAVLRAGAHLDATPDQVQCPGCMHPMSDDDVKAGFRTDVPEDISTRCPECGERFVTTTKANAHQYVWMCEDQTMAALDTWFNANNVSAGALTADTVLDQVLKDVPSIAWNLAIYHGPDVVAAIGRFMQARVDALAVEEEGLGSDDE